MEKLGFAANIITIIAGIITLLSFIVSSQVTTGNPFQWLQGLQTIHFVILSITIGATIGVMSILYRKHRLNNQGVIFPIRFYSDRPHHVGHVDHGGVIWEVYSNNPYLIGNYNLQVRTPPKCKNCNTKLEQNKGFFGGYVWNCVKCGKKIRNKDGFSVEAERAEKIAERDFEAEMKRRQANEGNT